MIRLENINKYYQSGNDKIHVLKNLNYVFPDTGLAFILGPSGSGKSTLLNLLGGLDTPDTGEIYIEDRPLSSFSNAERNNYLNSYLGFVFQEYNILKDLNLRENISLALEIQGYKKKSINKKITQIIHDVELNGLEKRKVNQLSGGQKQRIAIARALVKEPKLIIADEPTGNLDSETSKKIFELLKKLSKNRLIIIVSHDEESAQLYADEILRISTAQLENNLLGEKNDTEVYPSKSIDEERKTKALTTNQLVLKKAKTPILTISKLAFKNLWKKKFRYLLILVICAISLSFLSFAIELNGDKLYQNVYTTINNNVHYTDVYQYVENANADKNDFYAKYQMGQLQNGSYDSIKEIASDLTIHKYESISIDYTKYQAERQNFLYRGKIDTIIRYDDTNNYKLLAGRVPNNQKAEIMITDYLFEAFKHFGLIDQNSEIYDILNRSFDFGFQSSLKIVGVVETQYRNWLHLANQSIYSTNYVIDRNDKNFQGFEYDYLMMNCIIVSKEAYRIIYHSNGIITINNIPFDFKDFQPFDDSTVLVGKAPTTQNEITISLEKAKLLFALTDEELLLLCTNESEITSDEKRTQYKTIYNKIFNQKIFYQCLFNQNGVSEYPYQTTDTFEFSIVGITEDDAFFLSNENYDQFEENYQTLSEIKNNTQKSYQISQISFNSCNLNETSSIKAYESETTFAGSLPFNSNEIVVPLIYLQGLFNLSDYEIDVIQRYQIDRKNLTYYELTRIYKPRIERILNSTIRLTIAFTNEANNNKTYLTKTFKVCGLTTDENYILDSHDYARYANLIVNFTNPGDNESENIIVELPNNPKKALQIFNKLYDSKQKYVIDIFSYKDKIESFDVDPIIEFASTGGLIVFTILTIGIMWSVISIEIVDSKKEIGIMRSIGLTGFKVSLIFLIQMFFINIIAYGIAIPIANIAITSYGSNLKDALGEISLTMYSMTSRTPIYLAIFVIVITTISTFLPLIKIISQKIINVINERDK